jgi:hypothetical protein
VLPMATERSGGDGYVVPELAKLMAAVHADLETMARPCAVSDDDLPARVKGTEITCERPPANEERPRPRERFLGILAVFYPLDQSAH